MSSIILGDLHHGRKHNATYGDASIWDYKSLNLLKALLIKHNPDQVILSGDVFDNSKPSSLAYSELVSVLVRIPSVWIIAGNHDISKVEESIAFDNIGALDNVNLVRHSSLNHSADHKFNFIGWQPTQSHYDKAMKFTIEEAMEGTTIVTHCSRVDFGNENDNICTDEHIKLAKAKDIKIISGHEHKSSIGSTFSHIGSVVPHTIAEVGVRYYWLDGKFIELEDDGQLVLTREEPINIDPTKVYYVKTNKEVTIDDLKLEEKDLSIDILEDFWKEATKAGFSKELLND